MYKLLGAILLLSSALCCGACPIIYKMKRIRALSNLTSALFRMRMEMHAAAPSIPILIQIMCENSYGEPRDFFASIWSSMEEHGAMAFYSTWNIKAKEMFWMLTKQEEDALIKLGDVLGAYILEDQVQEIDTAITIFQNGILDTKGFLKEQGKLYLGTSLSIGLILVVVML